ncbi:MAG: hypothetical protein JNK38_00075 [Acidobacteria bacterium]|nr:hypothetical protein [Acidobacteriota bacterium]
MNYFNYFTEIEEEFVRRRGSHMLVSPLDWSLMESWRQRDIPLQVVLRGINNSFDGYDQRTHRGRKVNSLFYCQQEVEALFQEFTESRVGSSETTTDENGNDANGDGASQFTKTAIDEYLTERLETLTRIASRQTSADSLRETLERVVMRLEQIIEDLRTARTISPEDLETDLTMIEEVILDGLRESISEEQLKEIEQEGDRKLRTYKKSMGREVYEKTLGNFVAQRLREQFGVPRLSLFYL